MCTQAIGRVHGDGCHGVGRGYQAVGPSVRTRAISDRARTVHLRTSKSPDYGATGVVLASASEPVIVIVQLGDHLVVGYCGAVCPMPSVTQRSRVRA